MGTSVLAGLCVTFFTPFLCVCARVCVVSRQEYVRHLNSVVQGEYRDRVIVVHPQLRLYTRALGVFDALKGKVEMTAPRFRVCSTVYWVTWGSSHARSAL